MTLDLERTYAVGDEIAFPPLTERAIVLERFPPGHNGTWLRCHCQEKACLEAEERGRAAHVLYVTEEALRAS